MTATHETLRQQHGRPRFIMTDEEFPVRVAMIEAIDCGMRQAEERARRIVACCNACAGLSTEHLEGLGAGGLASLLEDRSAA